MFRVQWFHKEEKRPPARETTSIPVIFRSARPDDLIEFGDDFFFGYHVNKDNILTLFPDMQEINTWKSKMPLEYYSNTSFYSHTNTSNLILIGEGSYKQIAVIARREGENMKGFESAQVAIDPSKFASNHKYFPTDYIKKDTVYEKQLFRITGISNLDFGLSYDCTKCKIPIGLFDVSWIIH